MLVPLGGASALNRTAVTTFAAAPLVGRLACAGLFPAVIVLYVFRGSMNTRNVSAYAGLSRLSRDGQRYCTSTGEESNRNQFAESNCAARCPSVQLYLPVSTEGWRGMSESNRLLPAYGKTVQRALHHTAMPHVPVFPGCQCQLDMHVRRHRPRRIPSASGETRTHSPMLPKHVRYHCATPACDAWFTGCQKTLYWTSNKSGISITQALILTLIRW